MKGIYLTEEGKQEIEAKIAELEDIIEKYKECKNWMWFDTVGQLEVYKGILSSATIPPVEESWKIVAVKTMISPATESYPQGVIIQLKNKDANN
jgi:hypothetical protein